MLLHGCISELIQGYLSLTDLVFIRNLCMDHKEPIILPHADIKNEELMLKHLLHRLYIIFNYAHKKDVQIIMDGE